MNCVGKSAGLNYAIKFRLLALIYFPDILFQRGTDAEKTLHAALQSASMEEAAFRKADPDHGCLVLSGGSVFRHPRAILEALGRLKLAPHSVLLEGREPDEYEEGEAAVDLERTKPRECFVFVRRRVKNGVLNNTQTIHVKLW